jgi:drug/metabolite transporter (DMT)-like permease
VTSKAWIAFAALGVIWGIPYFFIKLAVQELSPFVIAWGRVTLAAAILLPVAWHRGALRSAGGQLGAILAFAVVEFVVPFSAIGVGERWIDSSTTGILIASVPLTVTLISRFFGVHEPLDPWRLAGLVVGLLGVIALLGLGTVNWPLGWAGVGCMLLATVGYAVGPLIIQKHLKGIDSLGPIALSLCASGILLLVPAALTLPAAMPSAFALTSIAVLGILCTAVAMLFMFYLVKTAGPTRATVITYINPIVATLLGVILLHEHLGVGGVMALGLILFGSWLATRGAAAKVVSGRPDGARLRSP